MYPSLVAIHDDLVALAGEARTHAITFSDVIDLQQSAGFKRITALKVIKNKERRRARVLITGGLLNAALPAPRAVLTCMHALIDAYEPPGKGITYGVFSLNAQDVRDIVERVNIYVLPVVNPDGYSQLLQVADPDPAHFDWTTGVKNGRNTAPCDAGGRPGVNINRNFDILWDYVKAYKPGDTVFSSADPCDPFYTGRKQGQNIGTPFSEPEAQNVKTLLDEGIEYCVNCDTDGRVILYPWGIGWNQSDNQDMRFNKPFYDGKRRSNVAPDLPPSEYREYIPGDELRELQKMAHHMATAIEHGTDVPGRLASYPFKRYRIEQGAAVHTRTGGADDYAYSRHFVNPDWPLVRVFTIGVGQVARIGFRPTEEHYAIFEQELHCALLSLLHHVAMWVGKRGPG